MHEIRQTVTVESEGVLEVRSPEFVRGASAEVIVRLAEGPSATAEPAMPKRTMMSLFGSAKGLFNSPEEVDEFLRRERDSWD